MTHLKPRPGAILGSQQDSCVALEMAIWSDVGSTENHHQHPHNNQHHWPNQFLNIILNHHPNTWLSRSLGESLAPRERSWAVAPSWTSQSQNIVIIIIEGLSTYQDQLHQHTNIARCISMCTVGRSLASPMFSTTSTSMQQTKRSLTEHPSGRAKLPVQVQENISFLEKLLFVLLLQGLMQNVAAILDF